MLAFPHEHRPLAHLLKFLEFGEQLAADCARAQAELVSDRKMKTFFRTQARQEQVHALAFQAAQHWLVPRGLGRTVVLGPLEHYRRLVERALAEGEFLQTVLAEQVILEGLGEAILARIEAGLVKRGAGFARWRRILLHQEEAHHAFGQRVVERSLAEGLTTESSLRAAAVPYLELTEEMLYAQRNLFEAIDEDPTAYLADAKRRLPPVLCS